LRRLFLAFGAALAAGFTSQPGGPVLITDVTVVDVNAGVSRPHQSVVVRDSLIEVVAPANAVKPPAGGRIVDGAGKFLIPGLWDTHVHLDGDGEVLRVFLAAGITGVRDMGGDLAPLAEARRLIDSGRWQGPRLVLAGPMIRGPQRESDKSGRGSRVVRTPAEGRQAVDELVALGVDFIKIQDFLSRESFLAIAAAARAKKIPLAGHVPPAVSPGEASEAGQTNITHFGELYPKVCAPLFKVDAEGMPDETCGQPARKAIYTQLVRNGTWFEPTIAQFQYLAPGNWRAIFNGFKRLVPEMRQSGLRVLAGTDWQNSLEARGGAPGITLHEELLRLVEAGFTPIEALRAATSNPAEFFGLKNQLGSVEPGKVADLVLLEGDPLADITNTQHVAAVMRDGQFIRR
jgi:imidazolonepropionase-like amidohydrolase